MHDLTKKQDKNKIKEDFYSVLFLYISIQREVHQILNGIAAKCIELYMIDNFFI